jgi:hypothetical protein
LLNIINYYHLSLRSVIAPETRLQKCALKIMLEFLFHADPHPSSVSAISLASAMAHPATSFTCQRTSRWHACSCRRRHMWWGSRCICRTGHRCHLKDVSATAPDSYFRREKDSWRILTLSWLRLGCSFTVLNWCGVCITLIGTVGSV